MSPSHAKKTPVVRFLGEEAGRGGPFALLGLPHSIETESDIRKAQQRRLRQVEHHPHRTTPDADEVRLAIHSAATQLMDPALREQLARRWPEGNPVDLPAAWRPNQAMKRLSPAFLRSARRVIGSSGGWNPVARRRLAHLARINRINALQIVRALGPTPPATPASRQASHALPKLPPEPDGGRGWVVAYAMVGLLACSLMITVVVNPIPQSPTPEDLSARTQPETAVRPIAASDPGFTATERERLSHYTAIAHEIDRLVARANTEPAETIERFSEIYPIFIERWTEFPTDALDRVALNISEMTARLERQGVGSERLPSLLAASGYSPSRVMIVAGILEVVLSSPQLSPQARDQLRALRERYSDSTIVPRTQLTPVLIDIASALAQAQNDDDPEWWGAWIQAVKHITIDSPHDRTRLLVEAMSFRLGDQTAPGGNWLKTASLLSRSLEWREQSAERYWLLGQFADNQVPTSRLSMLTEAIATGSAAEGIDTRMVLARDANLPQRTQLAQAYRDVWFPNTRSTTSNRAGATGGGLLQQLELEVLSTPVNPDRTQAIDKMVTLTALCVTAQLQIIGEHALSEELLLNTPALPADSSGADRNAFSIEPGDQEWAEAAINSESAATLRPLLDQLVVQDSIGINAAHALVYLATLRPQSEVRDLALAQLVRFRASPSVLLAIDHALDDSRVSARLDEVVGAVLEVVLPERTDPQWFLAARKALLTRLATRVGESDEQRVSQLPDLLLDLQAYLLTDAQRIQLDQRTTAAEVLGLINTKARLRLESEPVGSGSIQPELEQLSAQRLVLQSRAGSPMQRYLLELWYTFELDMLASKEAIPGSARVLRDIRDEYQQRDAASLNILQQIANTQRAIARVWILRLERGAGA